MWAWLDFEREAEDLRAASSRGQMRVSVFFFFSSRRRHTRFDCDWSSDVCSSDLEYVPHHPIFARANPGAPDVFPHGPVLLPPTPRVTLRRVGQLLVRKNRALQSQIGRASCRERV